MEWVYLDNKIVSQSKGLIPGFDEGFLVGQGLFETMRCYEGKIFSLERHLRRLIKSCPVLDIEAPSRERLEKAVLSVIQRNHLTNASLRLNVSKKKEGSCVFVFARRLSLPSLAQYKKGFSVALYEDERIGLSILNGVKSLNHYFYSRLSHRARREGYDEALFLNCRGEVVEGSRTNIFLVKGHKISTPGFSCGCLPGVTRAIVIELLKRLKIPVTERKVFPQELIRQDELFMTNSLIEVMPVTRLEKQPVGTGRAGRVTKEIMAAYKKEVEKECFLR